MLRVVACMLVLLAGASCLPTSPIPKDAKIYCPNNNPFIKQLRSDRVSLLPRPLKTAAVCGFEFNSFGSCCREKDLVEMARVKTAELMADVAYINEEYRRFNGVLSKAHKLLQQTAMTPMQKDSPKWNRYIILARETARDAKYTDYFSKYMKVTLDADKFAKANTKCWRMQALARNLALCYTCSGRSNIFFKHNKALISQETCDAFVRDCGYPLSDLIKFIRSFEKLPQIAFRLHKMGVKLNYKQKLAFRYLKAYFGIFRRQKIGDIIQTARNLHRPKAQASLCSKFLRLKDFTIISQMRRMFKVDVPWRFHTVELSTYFETSSANNSSNSTNKTSQTELISQNHNSSQAILKNPKTTWQVSRVLQFSPETESELLESDSEIIDATDPSYDSVGVSGNSPMEFGHQFP